MSVTFWTMASRSSVDATATPTSDSFCVMAACSCALASNRDRSVMSRAILEAPMMSPASFRIGETVNEIERRVPSFRRRIVS